MNKQLLKILFLLHLLVAFVQAQNLFEAEYFFDFDPGFGMGIPVNATEGDSVFSFSADTSSLTPGFHIMYVRARNNAGQWTQHVLKPFFIPATYPDTTRSKVLYAEYYFDMDPGFGNGTGMSLTASNTAQALFSIDKTSLKPGFHTLYVRAKDEKNIWTLHMAKPFLILENVQKSLSAIKAIEYYFYKDGIQSDTFKVADFEAGSDVEINFQPDFSNLLQDSTYDFHVYAIDSSGRRSIQFVFGDQIINDIAADEITALLPKTLQVEANYPNPFNPSTIIKFGLPASKRVKLVIYDIIGRKVAMLLNKQMNAGYHSIKWDGRNDLGQDVASGFYIYRVSTDEKVLSRKMILLR